MLEAHRFLLIRLAVAVHHYLRLQEWLELPSGVVHLHPDQELVEWLLLDQVGEQRMSRLLLAFHALDNWGSLDVGSQSGSAPNALSGTCACIAIGRHDRRHESLGYK